MTCEVTNIMNELVKDYPIEEPRGTIADAENQALVSMILNPNLTVEDATLFKNEFHNIHKKYRYKEMDEIITNLYNFMDRMADQRGE